MAKSMRVNVSLPMPFYDMAVDLSRLTGDSVSGTVLQVVRENLPYMLKRALEVNATRADGGRSYVRAYAEGVRRASEQSAKRGADSSVVQSVADTDGPPAHFNHKQRKEWYRRHGKGGEARSD